MMQYESFSWPRLSNDLDKGRLLPAAGSFVVIWKDEIEGFEKAVTRGWFGGTPVWQSSKLLMMLLNLEPSLIFLVTDLKLCNEILLLQHPNRPFTVVR